MSSDIPSAPLDSMANKPPKVYVVDLEGKLRGSPDIFVDVIRWIWLSQRDSK
ncbi:hypothetical protein IRB23M11_24080 [Alkalibacterium sp. m-11]